VNQSNPGAQPIISESTSGVVAVVTKRSEAARRATVRRSRWSAVPGLSIALVGPVDPSGAELERAASSHDTIKPGGIYLLDNPPEAAPSLSN